MNENETHAESGTARRGRGASKVLIAVVLTAVVTFGMTALLVNILERRSESAQPSHNVVELDDSTYDPAVWGQNYPQQYASHLRTVEMGPTVYGGSTPVDLEPSETDPRSVGSSSRLEEDPRLTIMWAGYPFAKGYTHARGHEWMLDDQRYTVRVLDFDQPGTCLNCHASMPEVYDELGDGDRMAGFDAVNRMAYDEATQHASGPIACIDCHDPETMALRITRPAFITGIAALKASEGIEDYDVNRDATRDEMRSYVCAQCHVEYYFDGDAGNRLTYPWSEGNHIDDIWEYYQKDGHIDFEHEITGASILKAQHPEFEIWSQGVHASAGVSCADCHMSYDRSAAQKVTNHHINSPLFDANASCGTCHSDDAETLVDRVVTIQDRFVVSRNQAFDALVSLIYNIEEAMGNGVDDDALDLAREYQNKASFYLDFVYSENSYGFHASAYTQAVLIDSMDASRMGELALAGASREDLEASEVTQKYAQDIDERTGLEFLDR